MPATRSDILRWLERAQEEGATHMIVKCDTFEYRGGAHDSCCYPVNVSPDEDVRERIHGGGRLMEVYSLTGQHTIDAQMREHRAFHYD